MQAAEAAGAEIPPAAGTMSTSADTRPMRSRPPAAVKADTRDLPRAQKIIANKPADIHDQCSDASYCQGAGAESCGTCVARLADGGGRA